MSLHSKLFIQLIFVLFLEGFLIQLEDWKRFLHLWEGEVRAGSVSPDAACPVGCSFVLPCQVASADQLAGGNCPEPICG